MEFHSNYGQESGNICGSCCGGTITDDLQTFNSVNYGITFLLSDKRINSLDLDDNNISLLHELEVPSGWLYVKQLQEPVRINVGSNLPKGSSSWPLRQYFSGKGFGPWYRWFYKGENKELENAVVSCHTSSLTDPFGTPFNNDVARLNYKNSIFLFIQTPGVWDNYNLDELAKARGLKHIYTGPRSYNWNYLFDEDGEPYDEDDYERGGKRLQLKVYYHE